MNRLSEGKLGDVYQIWILSNLVNHPLSYIGISLKRNNLMEFIGRGLSHWQNVMFTIYLLKNILIDCFKFRKRILPLIAA